MNTYFAYGEVPNNTYQYEKSCGGVSHTNVASALLWASQARASVACLFLYKFSKVHRCRERGSRYCVENTNKSEKIDKKRFINRSLHSFFWHVILFLSCFVFFASRNGNWRIGKMGQYV